VTPITKQFGKVQIGDLKPSDFIEYMFEFGGYIYRVGQRYSCSYVHESTTIL